jgi:hypothetical protein
MADNGVGAEPIQPYTRAVDSRRRPPSCLVQYTRQAAKVTPVEAKRNRWRNKANAGNTQVAKLEAQIAALAKERES